MAESENEWISKRAYALWEEEGCPTGKDTEHWERAKLEFATFAPIAANPVAKKGKPAEKSTATPVASQPEIAPKKDPSVKKPAARKSSGK